MSIAIERIENAYKWVMANRPSVNRYPYLAEALRKAGVKRYVYNLPSNQCIFYTNEGHILSQTEVSNSGLSEVPQFNKEEFIKVLKVAQAGKSTFPEFLRDSWKTGIVSYEADLESRKVSYFGSEGEAYIEDYPAVEVDLRY